MKLWNGRFKKNTHSLVDEYTASINFDHQLAAFDILGSIAHVKMLNHCKLISKKDADLMIQGLKKLAKQAKAGKLPYEVVHEDIHMNVEVALHKAIGPIANQLHTGRSRNDQVALDMHLYLRYHVVDIVEKIYRLLEVILSLANVHFDVIMPGYTHLQRAEPIRFSHHLLAYFQMFHRDALRLIKSFVHVNVSPLGAGALAGSGVKVDPMYVAELLMFDNIYSNSLDAISNRDFIVEFLANASLMMMHFSKLSEEIILWNTHEFSFITLSDEFCTGSSMMPQKKNPDVAELARGKTGRVYGSLLAVLTMLKGLPFAYNKDMQEDKEGLFDTVNTIQQTLGVFTPMLATLKINSQRMKKQTECDYSNATQLANYLVGKGMSFRKAHEMTGKIVLYAIENKKYLNEISLDDYQSFYENINSDVYQKILINQVIESHQTLNGTAKKSVQQQLMQAFEKLKSIECWIKNKQPIMSLVL